MLDRARVSHLDPEAQEAAVTSTSNAVDIAKVTTLVINPCHVDPNSDHVLWAQCRTLLDPGFPVESNVITIVSTLTGEEARETEIESRTTATQKSESTEAASIARPSKAAASTSSASTRQMVSSSITAGTDQETSISSHNQSDDGPSSGTIAGAACGVLVVIGLIAGVLWFTRKKWLGYMHGSRSTSENRSIDEKYSFDRSPSPRQCGPTQVELEGEVPGRSFTSSPTAPYAVMDVGLGANGVADNGRPRHYRLTNPDPASATTDSHESRKNSITTWQPPEPEDRPMSEAVSPLTATTHNPFRDSGELPSPLIVDQAYPDKAATYTPSVYTRHPPSSLPGGRSVEPPHPPQQPAAVRAGTVNDRRPYR